MGEGMRGEFGHGDSVAPVGGAAGLVEVFDKVESVSTFVEYCTGVIEESGREPRGSQRSIVSFQLSPTSAAVFCADRRQTGGRHPAGQREDARSDCAVAGVHGSE